jgi:hypothetical protein
MRVWKGWLATSAGMAGGTTPTWEAWRAQQQRALHSERRRLVLRQVHSSFSDRELARLSFVRWLYQRGHLDRPIQRETTTSEGEAA